MFTAQDLAQINSRGIDLRTVERQINHFRTGFPFIVLDRPATVGDGLLSYSEAEIDEYINYFSRHAPTMRVVKFVPASGAASRMFKHLFEFAAQYTPDAAGDEKFNQDQSFNSVWYFINHLGELAAFKALDQALNNSGSSLQSLMSERQYGKIIDGLLGPTGLDYAALPKALLLFHDYGDGPRTAAEEHLVEAANYAANESGTANIHFTISPEHRDKFIQLFKNVVNSYEEKLNVHYEIGFSIQKPSTDTIAVDEANEPFRNQDGSLVFRPGGHGALIDNLQELDHDVIFVKNIDNIVPDRLKDYTFRYKKLIGGLLLTLKKQIDLYLNALETNELTDVTVHEIADFAIKKLHLSIPSVFYTKQRSEQIKFLINLLNRPVRICGMVRNVGEPGGGPFWVRGKDGGLSLQIVESSQIDFNNPVQKEIVNTATHFNPVDLVCTMRDYQGNKFDLKKFIDEDTGFISLKSVGGKTVKAQELPGLWNGAMAGWITLFVEVPIITFNPVKTINDLLRPEHKRD